MITGAPDVLVGPDAKQVESEVGQPSCLDVPDHRPAVVRHDVVPRLRGGALRTRADRILRKTEIKLTRKVCQCFGHSMQ